MPDPGQLSSSFLAGPQLDSDALDITNDLIPYFKLQDDGSYLACTVSPTDLYAAMSA